MTEYTFVIVVNFLVLVLVFISSETVIASYDEFEAYDEEQLVPSSRYETISPSEPPLGDLDNVVFDVSEFGAIPDADTDSTYAFEKTWEAACKHEGITKFYVPEGKFLVGAIEFKGPCSTKSTLEVEIRGDLMAPTSIKQFPFNQWITFTQLNDIVLYGRANLEGRGEVEAWKQESCWKASKCDKLITSLILGNVSNAIIRDITLSNAKGFHLGLHFTQNVTVQNVSISSPQDSPNTDGIHVHSSSYISINSSTIGVGDDCVSISTGSFNVLVFNTRCGPGHGISIGSLGKNKNEEEVRGIRVQNCTINGTDNGVRIKTWPTSPPSQASDMIFEDIIMMNVSNPIIINQEYCPSNSCSTTFASMVKLSNIEFKNIRGTYNTEFGVTLRCSSLVACENITLIDVNLSSINTTEEMKQERFSMKGSLHGLAVFNSNFN
ncbi:hypothetical protein EUTSA_v10005587mg [Eutrema salsugineum]|uniref:Pectate lyase superfamily protein domain-containing protein n=1 Tax=Eutrema salsugineum TaxID=72664 RepID=V4KQV2_EUTSA|nr:exopolygalacturonase [Eutrema salsugineum]ESQ32372.1 hypothetical protein EUTSA_v10005587mg [Eutrema salsugineum]